jgi:hypothetical protein
VIEVNHPEPKTTNKFEVLLAGNLSGCPILGNLGGAFSDRN